MARNRGLPHFLQIADKLMGRVEMSSAGWRLPSVQSLARSEKVSINTANSAIAELRRRGLVASRRGSGSFSIGQTGPLVQVCGHICDAHKYSAFFGSLAEHLSRQGLRVALHITGYTGEKIQEWFRAAEISQAAIVVWMAPGHPEGIRRSTQARRLLPVRLPMVLLNDPLGLDLEGSHRIDLLHWDTARSTRKALETLHDRGCRHVVLIQRSDVDTYTQHEERSAFLSSLTSAGVEDPLNHIFQWQAGQPGSLAECFNRPRNWQPDAFLLQFDYETDFRAVSEQEGIALSPDHAIISTGQAETSAQLLSAWRGLARTCANLVQTRLADPGRPNLRISAATPRRKARKQSTNS